MSRMVFATLRSSSPGAPGILVVSLNFIRISTWLLSSAIVASIVAAIANIENEDVVVWNIENEDVVVSFNQRSELPCE